MVAAQPCGSRRQRTDAAEDSRGCRRRAVGRRVRQDAAYRDAILLVRVRSGPPSPAHASGAVMSPPDQSSGSPNTALEALGRLVVRDHSMESVLQTVVELTKDVLPGT